ncbi:MAG TPA: hypothetical protein VJT31_25250 [Rugosimonospora sp.]|nr:hypothetical protein [Rugosimonospora sp.]
MAFTAGAAVGLVCRELPAELAAAVTMRAITAGATKPPCPGSLFRDCLGKTLVEAGLDVTLVGVAVLGTYVVITLTGTAVAIAGGILAVQPAASPWLLLLPGIGACLSAPGYWALVRVTMAVLGH